MSREVLVQIAGQEGGRSETRIRVRKLRGGNSRATSITKGRGAKAYGILTPPARIRVCKGYIRGLCRLLFRSCCCYYDILPLRGNRLESSLFVLKHGAT